MLREPWVLTHDMFLDEPESDRLLVFLRDRESHADASARDSATVDRLIVESLMLSGLRNSEFCALRVRDTIVGRRESVFVVAGTPREDRTVHVPTSLSRLVSHFVSEIRPRLLPDRVSPRDLSQPLIVNERGRPYERTNLYRRVVRILTEAGFGERASVQFLRHTYGYLAYKRTAGNLLFVQRQLGHAHPMVTAIYEQFVEQSYASLAETVGATAIPAQRTGRRTRSRQASGGVS
jgi:integrase/recombinase XerD